MFGPGSRATAAAQAHPVVKYRVARGECAKRREIRRRRARRRGSGDAKGKKGEQTQLCGSLRSGARGDAAVPELCLAVNCVAGRKSGWWHEVRGTRYFSLLWPSNCGSVCCAGSGESSAPEQIVEAGGLSEVGACSAAVVVGQGTPYQVLLQSNGQYLVLTGFDAESFVSELELLKRFFCNVLDR